MGKFPPYQYIGGDRHFSLSVTINTPEKWDMWQDVSSIFMDNFKVLFKYAVYDANKYLIRATPMLTGRLRGGWTSFLNAHNVDYSSAFMDVTLVWGHNEPLSPAAINEGMMMSYYQESDFLVTLINAVPYVDYVEMGTSKMEGYNFTSKTVYKAEYIIKKYIEDWTAKCSEAGAIIEPEILDEVQV